MGSDQELQTRWGLLDFYNQQSDSSQCVVVSQCVICNEYYLDYGSDITEERRTNVGGV